MANRRRSGVRGSFRKVFAMTDCLCLHMFTTRRKLFGEIFLIYKLKVSDILCLLYFIAYCLLWSDILTTGYIFQERTIVNIFYTYLIVGIYQISTLTSVIGCNYGRS